MGKGKQNKFKERKAASYNREVKSIELRLGQRARLIVISFKDFDRNQGETFEHWEGENLLSLAVIKLQGVCGLTRIEATYQQIIKEYPKGIFPDNFDFIIQNTFLKIFPGVQCTFRVKNV